MSENKKPRIAEILGVEVGERFSVEGQCGGDPLYVDRDGWVRYVGDGAISTSAVTIAINHPDRIIRKRRWTEQEVEILKHMASAGIVSIKRKSIVQISWDAGTMGGVMIVPPRFLPSIQPGQSYTLDEIIGGTNE